MKLSPAQKGSQLASLDEFLLAKARTAPSPVRGSLQELVEQKSKEALEPQPAHPPAQQPLALLSGPAAQEVSARWPRLCEELFEYLAEHYPRDLLRMLLKSRMPVADLTFAAEIAGRIIDSAMVRPILLLLLRHRDAVVREGALYGLARHVDETVTARLVELAEYDPSPAVRTIALDLLDLDRP